ncbi:MAG: DUF881 domain-containing protein [Firmicutes bacterium]|nr:DUF881 domain-containing protein [Bacillota bacterium]
MAEGIGRGGVSGRVVLPPHWQWSMALVLFVLGALVAVQLRSQLGRPVPLGTARMGTLAQMYQEVASERDALQKEVVQQREQLLQAMQGQEQTKVLAKELERTRLWAGLTAVEGPGVEVTVQGVVPSGAAGRGPGAPGNSGGGGGPENPSSSAGQGQTVVGAPQVEDQDLQLVVNELAAAGAQAIAINGQRRVAMTEIRRAGTTIVVNNVPINEPYVITAIGDPATLANALSMRGGVADRLATWGIQVKIVKKGSLVLPAFAGPLETGEMKAVPAAP